MGLFDHYFADLQRGFSSIPRALGRKWFRTYMHPRSLYRVLAELPKGSQVLDVGCGPGNILKIFKQHRDELEYVGVDWSIPENAHEDEGPSAGKITFVESDVTKELAFENRQFELITCYFVIEHIELKNLERFCQNLVSMLKPGGYLFLTVPNPRSVYLDFYDDPTHIRPYTSTALKKLFEPLGIVTHRHGIDRSWKILFLSPFYRLYTLFKKDPSGISFFRGHLFGATSYFLGIKR